MTYISISKNLIPLEQPLFRYKPDGRALMGQRPRLK
jgi:hypothetical protein